MLDIDYPWDSCQLPINVFDSLYRSFQREVLPELNRRGIAALGMKSLGGDGQFITAAGLSPEECRRYALSQPITTLVCGMQTIDNLAQDLAIARNFVPMSVAEQAALRERVRREATDGRHEWFKSTTFFDSQYHRDQHGFSGACGRPALGPRFLGGGGAEREAPEEPAELAVFPDHQRRAGGEYRGVGAGRGADQQHEHELADGHAAEQ